MGSSHFVARKEVIQMPTQRKINTVAELTDKLARQQLTIVADYRGLSMADLTKLRTKLRETGAEFIVAKNTLIKIAARDTGSEVIEGILEGPTGLVIAYDDIAKSAKVFQDFVRDVRKPVTIRGGLIGKSALPADGLDAVTRLPSRTDILAQIVGGVSAPLTGVVGVVNAIVSNIAAVIQAKVDQMGGESTEAPAA
jgi:large subunit ribosomal protein L10